MRHRFAASAVFWFHWILSLWVFIGVPVELWYPRYVKFHVLFLGLIIAAQSMLQGRCPLTDFEKAMLAKCAPDEVYEGSFLRHYMKKHFGVTIPLGWIGKSTIVLFLGSAVLWGVHGFAGR